MHVDPLVTDRLELRAIDLALVAGLLDAPAEIDGLVVPEGWPDADGRAHLLRWQRLLLDDGGPNPWRARVIVGTARNLLGHAGFHGPPQPIEEALSDPTYRGAIDPCDGGAVEIGYTILPSARRRGFAAEAVRGLVDWAATTARVGAIIATVDPTNAASLAVLGRVGGFRWIGTCRDVGEEHVFRRDL